MKNGDNKNLAEKLFGIILQRAGVSILYSTWWTMQESFTRIHITNSRLPSFIKAITFSYSSLRINGYCYKIWTLNSGTYVATQFLLKNHYTNLYVTSYAALTAYFISFIPFKDWSLVEDGRYRILLYIYIWNICFPSSHFVCLFSRQQHNNT